MHRLNDLKIVIRAHLWLIPLFAVLVGLFVWALDPAPPTRLRMATGSEGGGYHDFGRRLQARLEQEGIELELQTSKGSMDNLRHLLAGDAVQFALVQSGTELLLEDSQRRRLKGLGVMYSEPLWLFARQGLVLADLRQLRSLRLGLGSEGSGTLAAVQDILAASVEQPGADWQPLGGRRALEALLAGELDAAFFVGPPNNDMIRELAAHPQLQLLEIPRTAALQAHFPFLSALRIPQGLLDLARDTPQRDLQTLSPLATLVANDSLHPALTPMLLEAARDVLRDGNLLDPPNGFPRAEPMSLPLTAEAAGYYRNGPPYLQRYLPFSIASWVDRYILLLLPFIAILLPLFKSVSPLYQWRMRSRIFKWYRYLHETDEKIHDGSIGAELDEQIRRMEQLDNELRVVEVPLSYSHELFTLHLHVRYMIDRLRALQSPDDSAAAQPQLQ
ncbi:putative periplasmic transport protein [Pseudomonas sp. BAY1663]|uniref:C4-dicarboxylate ABC transporter substrate-binding protein n=1 Tax=Stutzerimonas stutzeri TaxID=316 RepID=A0A2N8T5X7_STUST|nr:MULTISPECIES: TAXI family TRAP transporter solute-binding subunit [Pseudomonadaceae]EXF46337.1 putative periplasmic transport protein [Pseudomonas sp. BAY1663]MCQ4325963.1 C4-dicarboxylate ABC transporter substrate-binding protein [Stutzerimonas stutzeri]PNG10128.1 C4-dicarboxylate ABC transporter substrate-binding protein [Stutzerimonas stutzeri]